MNDDFEKLLNDDDTLSERIIDLSNLFLLKRNLTSTNNIGEDSFE